VNTSDTTPDTAADAMPPTAGPLTNNRRTVAAYEEYAVGYAEAVAPDPAAGVATELRRLADVVGPGGTVLEVGSGPGWDADQVESLGVSVRRTDVTRAFREFQAERGKHVELLDVITDDLGGPYDAVMAMCVLLHIDRELTDTVLGKVAGALRPDGAFLVSLREGSGELWESGDYHVVLWSRAAFSVRLAAVGLRVEWCARTVHSDGPWLTFLARRTR
jgi:predicted TPR repeat methyltransferase